MTQRRKWTISDEKNYRKLKFYKKEQKFLY